MPALTAKKKIESVPKVKFSINREVLAKYLSVLSTASSKIVKASQCVLFTVKDSNLTVRSTNLSLYLKYDHGKVDCPDCNFMLPIEYINPLVGRSEAQDVVLEQIDHQRFKLTTDGEYTFSVMDGIEFPECLDEYTPFMKINSDDLKEYLRCVEFAVSQDVTKSRFLGIYFDGNFIATNGKHVACVETKIDGKFPELFIPRNVSNMINKFEGEVELGLTATGNQLVVKSVNGNLTAVFCLLVFEKFLAYKALFSKFTLTNSFEFDVKQMASALNRFGIFVNEFSSGVYCNIDAASKKLTISCGKGDNGVEVINLLSYTGPDTLSFILNHTALSDLMQVVKNKVCKVKFATGNEPFIIEDDNFKFMMSLMVEN